jgi:hypothetical protein
MRGASSSSKLVGRHLNSSTKQAEAVDAIEAGRRVSGTVRLALEVPDSEGAARRLVAAGALEVAPPVTTP